MSLCFSSCSFLTFWTFFKDAPPLFDVLCICSQAWTSLLDFLLFASSCNSPLESFSAMIFPSLQYAPLAETTSNNPLHPAHVSPRLEQHSVLETLAEIYLTTWSHFKFKFKCHAFSTEPHLSESLFHVGLSSGYQFLYPPHPTSIRLYQYSLAGTSNL